jgi:hypothetical protein
MYEMIYWKWKKKVDVTEWMKEWMVNGNRRMMLVWFGSSIGSSFDVEIRHGPYMNILFFYSY